jgi:hypothetical protein
VFLRALITKLTFKDLFIYSADRSQKCLRLDCSRGDSPYQVLFWHPPHAGGTSLPAAQQSSSVFPIKDSFHELEIRLHHDERQRKIRLNKETARDIRWHHDLASAAQNPASAAQKPVASYTGPLKGIGMRQNTLPPDIIFQKQLL